MPSIFTRHRRGSESLPNAMPDEAAKNTKRRSMDTGRPPVTGGKFKGLFGSGGGDDGSKRRLSSASQIFADDESRGGSLRQKLTSASQLFHRNEPLSAKPTTPISPQTPSRPPGAGARYDDPVPRSPNAREFASPTLAPESFALASTTSPEGSKSERRRSVGWEPSYPTVLPDDAYADLAPDGHPATDRQLPKSPIMPSENEHRRSLMEANRQLATPDSDRQSNPADTTALAPNTLAAQLRPNGQIPTPSPDEMPRPKSPTTPPPTLPAPLPTPPPSAISPGRALPAEEDLINLDQPVEPIRPAPASAQRAKSPLGRPTLSIDVSPTQSASVLSPDANMTNSPQAAASPSASPVTRNGASAPASPRPNGKARPDVPLRRSTLIQSPPMPQPIKNLPSMVGWPAFMKDGVPGTPGWGQMAKDGAPKTPSWTGGAAPRTPGWGGMMSPASARIPGTPGTPGFPFALPQASQNKGKGKESMSEEELRKARRAMPVMLRQPSTKPEEQNGGEVGASDEDDEESDTEIEGQGDDDSDDQTETEPSTKTNKKPSMPLKNRFKGKGKGKAVSSLATTAVVEEEDGATASTPPAEPTSNSQDRPGNLRLNTNSKAKSFWSSLPTPGGKAANSSWMQFSGSPTATPIRPNGGGASGTTSRTESATGSEITDSYFSSNPSSVSLGTPRGMEPVLDENAPSANNGLGLGPIAAAQLAQARLENARKEVAEADGGEASDEGGSEESADASSQEHDTNATTSPQIDQDATVRPTPTKRPTILSRHSRSMVDLVQPEAAPTTGTQLETIRSREAAPTKIEMPTKKPMMNGIFSPAAEWAKAPPTPAAGMGGFFWQKTKEGREIGTLKRRRSADDLNASPPKYEPPFPGTYIPRPRDEEGREKLPGYWCAVHIEGNMQRKCEFSSPGVQSRDRSWKKLYFILHGTSLSVYKFDPHRFPLKVDPHPPVPTVTEIEDEEYLHVHCPAAERRGSISVGSPQAGRRGSIPDNSALAARRGSGSTIGATASASSPRRASVSSVGVSPASSIAPSTTSEKDPALFPSSNTNRRASVTSTSSTHSAGTSSIASHFQQNQLIKQYSLQNAESGLAADYVKRKNVVRVRSEGEQFLLQTDSARDVVDWIEAIQAATNVALDLDERPMPKIITLPRRRRRRVPGAPGAAGAAGAAAGTTAAGVTGDANPAMADTPEGNAAAVAAAERASRERERMLAEDQAGPVNGN